MTIEQEIGQRYVERLKQNGICDLHITLSSIQPSRLSSIPLEKQEKLIALVKAGLSDSWAFFGSPGTGKTTLANLLFKEATFQRVCTEFRTGTILPANVWRATARQICQQAQDRATGRDIEDDEDLIVDVAATRSVQAKLVNRERFQRALTADLRPSLFIEEFDKISASQFQLLSLFDVLDAITSMKGQLVLTSNLTWDDFCQTFGGTSWRVEQNCHILEMFDGKVTVTPPKARTLSDW